MVPLYGLIAVILFTVMVILSFELVRRSNYELFFIVHQLYLPAVILLCLHVKNVYIGFLPGLLLKVIDNVNRVIADRSAKDTLDCSVEGDDGDITMLRCELPSGELVRKKSQYMYNNISSMELSRVGDAKVIPSRNSKKTTANAAAPSSSDQGGSLVDISQLGHWYFLKVSEGLFVNLSASCICLLFYSMYLVLFNIIT